MYGELRTRTRHTSQAAGLSAAVVLTASVGYGLATGIGREIARIIETPMSFAPISEEKAVLASPQETTLPMLSGRSLPRPPLAPPTEIFTLEDDRPPSGAAASDARVEATATLAGTGGSGPRVRSRPVMLAQPLPRYPASEVRLQHEGATLVDVCIDATGRVTKASLASTSGYRTLDEAALKWVRDARFTPARVDGVSEAVCGHRVIYQWTLENVRR